MPIIQINLLEGRSTAQKRELVASITEAVIGSLGVGADSVRIIINEMAAEHFALAGVTAAEQPLHMRRGPAAAAAAAPPVKLASLLADDGQSLPAGFEDLQPFVAYWAGASNDARWDLRAKAPMDEIRRFYDAMYARAEDAIAHLDNFPLDGAPPAETRLAQLLMALGQAAIAVEMHGQPRSPHSVFPHGIKVVNGPWPLG